MTQATIGEAARLSGVSAKMIRHYESIGLLPPAARGQGNYRLFSPDDIHTLRFIGRARDFGFSIARIRTLVGLWQARRPSREVKALTLAHVAELDTRIAALTEMRDALAELAETCHGDGGAACPILRGLEG